MRIAVLGTGTMGTGVAHSLLRNGLDVTVWNRHPERAKPLGDDGARVADSAKAAVADADVVLTILFDESAVTEVAGEFLGSMAPGAIWMQTATVGPEGAKRLAALAGQHGATFLDAPVVGTKQPAEEGKLVVLTSGDAEAVKRIAPVLDAIGSKSIDTGADVGSASALKLACNAWIASLTAGVAQSIAMCEALGVDPGLFLRTIDGGPSNAPYAQLKGGMMLDGAYPPSFAVDGLVKDLNLLLDSATPTGTTTTLLAALRDLFAVTSDREHADDDVAAVVTAFGIVG
jgi:3-hydroxyisobutyrate dehydrogenase